MNHFTPLSQIRHMQHKAIVNTIGICREIGEMTTVRSRYKNNITFQKRNITLVDTCNVPVGVTLWNGDAVNMSNDRLYQVLEIESGQINVFNGTKSINLAKNSKMEVNPEIPECQELKDWFKNNRNNNNNLVDVVTLDADCDDVRNLYTFNESRGLRSGKEFKIKAVINLIDCKGACYKACPKCPKKVVQLDDGRYSCNKCRYISPYFKFMLWLKIRICDGFSSEWVTVNNAIAEELLGYKTQHICEIIYTNPDKVEDFFERIYFRTYIFTLNKKWSYNQGSFQIISISPISYKEYNTHLINNINKCVAMEDISNK